MRATVGPLPSAVYWRRRAVVAAALLLGIIVLFVSCGGNGDDDKRGSGASSQPPVAPPASTEPTDDPSFGEPPPGAGNPSLPDPEDLQSGGVNGATPTTGASGADGADGSGTNGTGTNGTGTGTGTEPGGTDTNVTVPAGSCTNTEMSLTPIPSATTIKRGASVDLSIKIKNVSARGCSRDVGADLQELYIESGAQKIWSSDTCGTARGSDVYAFPAGGEREFRVTWNGNEASKCTDGVATGPAAPAGQYQLRLRLGDKVSDPVSLTVTA